MKNVFVKTNAKSITVHFDFLCSTHGGDYVSKLQRECKECGIMTNTGKVIINEKWRCN